MEINSFNDLAHEIGCNREQVGRRLFKDTQCGIVFNQIEDGVSVCGYAEGADVECTPHELKYPFTREAFWNAVKAADAEGCEMWHEWNDEDMTI